MSDEPTSAESPLESETPAAPPQPVAAPTTTVRKKKGAANDPCIWGTGRRKTSVARVRIREGEGKFVINDREVDVGVGEHGRRNPAAGRRHPRRLGLRYKSVVLVSRIAEVDEADVAHGVAAQRNGERQANRHIYARGAG